MSHATGSDTAATAAWRVKVESYLRTLQQIAETMDLLLLRYRPDRAAADTKLIEENTNKLADAVAEMERMVAQRELLLADNHAPVSGASISEKLRGTDDPECHRLATLCEELSQTLATSQQRAVSLFVCQFHLTQLSSEIIGILSAAPATGTYGPQGTSEIGTNSHAKNSGGGLFNEAG